MKFSRQIELVYTTLQAARPTAVDPVNAMNDVRRVMARGESVAEQQALALAAAEEAIEAWIDTARELGREVPVPQPHRASA